MSLKSNVNGVISLITSKGFRFNYMASHGFFHNLSDEELIRRSYETQMGKKLNLDNPETFNEKIQWIKLHYRKPEYTLLTDKYEVKKWVAEKSREVHVPQLLGVWESVEDIDYDKLPNKFVLKCTHDSGGLVICLDKATFNRKKAKKKLTRCLKRNYYWGRREWQYKDIKPRIIAEEYLEGIGGKNSVEYKVSCFDGKVKFITVCQGKAHETYNDRTNDHYSRDWSERYPFEVYYKSCGRDIEKPNELEELVSISETLAEGFPYVRVDCYIVNGKIYFGEMTFSTWSGLAKFNDEKWDYLLGSWIPIP